MKRLVLVITIIITICLSLEASSAPSLIYTDASSAHSLRYKGVPIPDTVSEKNIVYFQGHVIKCFRLYNMNRHKRSAVLVVANDGKWHHFVLKPDVSIYGPLWNEQPLSSVVYNDCIQVKYIYNKNGTYKVEFVRKLSDS